jgi:hypothetical protein
MASFFAQLAYTVARFAVYSFEILKHKLDRLDTVENTARQQCF